MKQRSILGQSIGALSMFALVANLPMQVQAKPTQGFTATQKAEIEAIVRQYLVDKNPATINEAMQVFNQREQDRKNKAAQDMLARNKSLIFEDPSSPILGNPNGDVTIVEFYDYSCGYCKASHAAVVELLKTDKNIRLIAKEFPILGEGSMLAARAALASVKQNKFDKFHTALMEYRQQFDETAIVNLARQVGLDPVRLKQDMSDKKIDETLAKNHRLGYDLGISGTPMFIIGDTVNPGALDVASLKQAVANARSANRKVGLSSAK